MSGKTKDAELFLADIPDEKLKNFREGEYTIARDYDLGLRLDHQGMNKDKNEAPHVHRLYIQPVGRAKARSKRSGQEQSNAGVKARCHATDTAKPEEIREALIESFRDGDTNVGYAPPK
ncbi:unnamed protein product [Clonostachys rhizophaga]|uniref:Uncharacterized protein n=1 Tax=Clonostachys rhizophaga TaxID=160324 RepID=A0A9N9W426_9HYPO|nr:unnamed protein product [Clonostachys rhizophaga]